jgi:ribonuclease-3
VANNPRKEAAAALEKALGHTFHDRDLLDRALTHASVGDGARAVRHYERLEFLGDRVLGLLAAERLLALEPEAREGALSPKLAALVNGRTCARIARKIGLGEAIRLSPGETKSGGRDKDTILGDALEALIAALYIDAGLDRTRSVFLKFWEDEFQGIDEARAKDPKTQLQEWAQAHGAGLPRYEVVGRSGPDHAPRFRVSVSVEGHGEALGEAGSVREAEKAAAMLMLRNREGKA